eukprot:SAG11_NODE_4605_length_1838_cov_1.730305_1_plen_231_part_00
MAAEFGKPLAELFAAFEFEPLASASVAQVHRATLHPAEEGAEGQRVAVKVQHKGVAAMMVADMVAFKRITRLCAWLNPKYDAVMVILTAWENEMLKELDFNVEAANLRRVRANLAAAAINVLVPAPVEGLVGAACFAMEFIDGFKITDADQLGLHGVDTKALLGRVVQAYSQQLYVDGFFNADPVRPATPRLPRPAAWERRTVWPPARGAAETAATGPNGCRRRPPPERR